jgi:hypothetical protein
MIVSGYDSRFISLRYEDSKQSAHSRLPHMSLIFPFYDSSSRNRW